LTVISITIPNDLLKRFDDFIKTRGYYSRSEAFRDAIRNLMEETELTRGEGIVATTIMITYDYERRDVDMKLSEIRHEFDDIIIENLHRHIGQKYCLEIFIAEGENSRVLKLIGRVRGVRGVQQVKSILITL